MKKVTIANKKFKSAVCRAPFKVFDKLRESLFSLLSLTMKQMMMGWKARDLRETGISPVQNHRKRENQHFVIIITKMSLVERGKKLIKKFDM